MSWFRLFGRAEEPAPADPAVDPNPSAAPALPPYPPSGWGPPAPWPPAGGPATPAARPAVPPPPGNDPPTDPRGFPPQPGPTRPDPAEAAALASAFGVDYLSWDEADPARRGRVLHDYLAVPGADPARIGWSGRGRQRADFALPGRVRPDGDGRVLVDVRVRVTPYRAVGEHDDHATEPAPEPAPVGVPAVAPAPTGRGWRSLPSCWVRLSVPVVLDGDRLAVDAWEETLGMQAPVPKRPAATTGSDHTLADDNPLAERAGGAW